MILHTPEGTFVIHFYFIGERDAQGRWKVLGAKGKNKAWNRITVCSIHPGFCERDSPKEHCKSKPLCAGQARTSVKDQHVKSEGREQAFRRAIESLEDKAIKKVLGQAFPWGKA